MTIEQMLAARRAARETAAAIMARAKAPMTLHDHAVAYRTGVLGRAADQTACSAKCDTHRDDVCDAHLRATRGCVGHRHNRK